ncbi:hypothetical protein COA05_24070 [Bacillus thuringiensis]|nr:hypothetical protein CN358_11985 [Bacillus thuringiensis]PGQ23357.1 hypothetical protein COA05_24070 [Bacillus thuringiensis]RHW07741.1 hypothetical protein B7P27_16430 [Bacillus cereus]
MLSPPLLKVQKFELYINYMHVSSVSQYFQSFFFRLYAVFSSFSILLTSHKINADLHIPLKDFYLFPY